MVITAIQAILIAFAVGFVVGIIFGWKLTFNMRLAKIQEQQVFINKLKAENSKLSSIVRSYKFNKATEKVGDLATGVAFGVGKSAVLAATSVASAAGGVGSVASSLTKKLKFWDKKDKDEPATEE